MYTRNTRDITIEVVDAGAECDRVAYDDVAAVWTCWCLGVDSLCLDTRLADLTFVEYCVFWDGDTVESAVVKDTALTELGVGLSLVEDKGAVDKDTAVCELEKVNKCCAVKDGAVWETPAWSEFSAFFNGALRTSVPRCFLVEHVIMGRGLSVPFVVKFVTHCVSLLECVKYRVL